MGAWMTSTDLALSALVALSLVGAVHSVTLARAGWRRLFGRSMVLGVDFGKGVATVAAVDVGRFIEVRPDFRLKVRMPDGTVRYVNSTDPAPDRDRGQE